MLLYTAELKRPRSIPLADKQAAVEQLLDKLALQPCRWGSAEAQAQGGGQGCQLAAQYCSASAVQHLHGLRQCTQQKGTRASRTGS
jgi:hypothetical protein